MAFTKAYWKENKEELIKKLKKGAKNRKAHGHTGKKHTDEFKKQASERMKKLYKEEKIKRK